MRRAWYHPTLSVSWLAAAACACVLLSVLATVLLHEDGPPIVRLSVDTENDPGHSPAAQPMGHAVAKAPGVMATGVRQGLGEEGGRRGEARARPRPPREPHPSPAPVPGIGIQPTTGLPPVTAALEDRTSAPSPSPRPKPTPTPSSAKPAAVTNLTLALVGGDQLGPERRVRRHGLDEQHGAGHADLHVRRDRGRAPVTQTDAAVRTHRTMCSRI